MGRAKTRARKIAISAAVRFKQSPRGLANKLVTATPPQFTSHVRAATRAQPYRQTGCPDAPLSKGVLRAAREVDESKRKFQESFELEDLVALKMERVCRCTKM